MSGNHGYNWMPQMTSEGLNVAKYITKILKQLLLNTQFLMICIRLGSRDVDQNTHFLYP